jgi:MFS family permease
LSFRDFRLFWIGLSVSSIGSWMQVFALGILVIQLAARDGSPDLAPLYLGLTGLARAIPGLALTIIAGAVADRSDRRRLLLVTQGVMSINASILALVTVLGVVTLWHVLIAAAVQSAAFAFDAPGRHSMLPRLVPPRAIASAIGLQSAAFNGAQIIGPLAAGILYFPIGIAGLLIINAASFIAILFALVAMAPIPRLSEPTHSVLRSVGHGMRYLKTNTRVAWLLSLTAVALFCTGSFVALLPAVAGDLRFLGTSWLSLLLAAVGVGALVGSFGLMRLGHSRYVGRIYAGATLFNGLAIVFFALSLQPAYALITAFAAGLAGTLMAGLTNTMLQGAITDEYRGRIMSIFSFMFIGLTPAGQLVLGAIGTPLGIHAALIVAGGVAFVVGLFGAIRVHVVRDWSQTHQAVAAGVRAPAAKRETVSAHSRDVVGGLTPTVTLGEASALK